MSDSQAIPDADMHPADFDHQMPARLSDHECLMLAAELWRRAHAQIDRMRGIRVFDSCGEVFERYEDAAIRLDACGG